MKFKKSLLFLSVFFAMPNIKNTNDYVIPLLTTLFITLIVIQKIQSGPPTKNSAADEKISKLLKKLAQKTEKKENNNYQKYTPYKGEAIHEV